LKILDDAQWRHGGIEFGPSHTEEPG
jgi:hypothetical protein